MVRLEWLFLMQFLMGILMVFFLQKLTLMKKQIDEVTKEVINYISYITEDMEEEELQQHALEKMDGSQEKKVGKGIGKKEKEEAQNRLIQAVLGEYFP